MFCVVKGKEFLGLAKLIDRSGNTHTVEYFDSPGINGRKIYQVPKSGIVEKSLCHNTRVYYYNDATSQWAVGRVLQDDIDHIEVRFPNMNDLVLSHESVYVRWKVPITNPVCFLGNIITETPQYAEARSNFLDSYIKQRGAAWGISALLSSGIDLEPHQINVVRRVLNDASQRYLLADEVGLGKTIEAGVIIRQAVLDNPRNHRVVVLVPASLVWQWRHELILRFGLFNYLDDSVFILPQELSPELESALTGATLLVIDEAHHLASGTNASIRQLYNLISSIAQKIDRLLLLSSTPVLRNEVGFLRMLHLLDPVVYDLTNENSFRSKILHRQALAETVAILDPQNVLHLDSVLDDLLIRLPGDDRLVELTYALRAQLVGLPEEDDPNLNEAIRLLRAHLSETYRLHRRILRNRRKHVKGLTPDRNGSQQWVVLESQMQRLEFILEAWRINAIASNFGNTNVDAKQHFEDFFWNAIAALLVHPEKLKTICRARLITLAKSLDRQEPSFEQESILLNEIIAAVDSEQWQRNRLGRLTTGVQDLLTSSTKIIIFCSDKTLADTIFTHFQSIIPKVAVRHEAIQDDQSENNAAAWLQFLSNPLIRVIICDQAAEEGINLQGENKIVIHFDVPMEPNRIEQRMGRVDRYGSGDPIESIVLLDEGSKYQKSWYTVLDKGLGVFNQSISTLQYLVDEQLQQLRATLFSNGLEAIIEMAAQLGGPTGMVVREFKLIDQHDSLDELSVLPEDDTEAIFEVDNAWKDIRKAMLYWVVDTLMFGLVPEEKQATKNAIDPPYRFQYQKPAQAGHTTLIPLTDLLEDFLGAIDYEARGSNWKQPRSYPHSANRTTAVKRGIRLLRYGDEFVEAVKSFSDLDDRGRSFAMWRQIYKGLKVDEFRIYFRFDFLIESQLHEVEEVLGSSSLHLDQNALSVISRRGDALFIPSVAHVWLDEDGEEPEPEFIEKFLAPRYAKNGVVDSHKDTNLNPKRFRSLIKAIPDVFSNWQERCDRMCDLANAILVRRQELINRKREAIARAQVEDEIRYAQLETRIQTLDGTEAVSEQAQLTLERKLNTALYNGIRTPSIKVDVAGVIFLSSLPFSYID